MKWTPSKYKTTKNKKLLTRKKNRIIVVMEWILSNHFINFNNCNSFLLCTLKMFKSGAFKVCDLHWNCKVAHCSRQVPLVFLLLIRLLCGRLFQGQSVPLPDLYLLSNRPFGQLFSFKMSLFILSGHLSLSHLISVQYSMYTYTLSVILFDPLTINVLHTEVWGKRI